jgi:hypothetical protein
VTTTPRDRYWDELGVAWRAVNPDVAVVSQRLRARLRRQSLLITSGLAIGLPAGAIGFVLGVWTIWRGWSTGTWNFVTRGAAIALICCLAVGALSLLVTVRASDAATSVSQMLALAIARARRIVFAIRLGLIACAVAVVMGLVGTAIRSALAAPPRLSPVVDVAVLMMLALGLITYGRRVRATLERLQALKAALDGDGDT